MRYHRQFTLILLTYFLLTSCLCSQPTRSRRQKRGIMKMMMHIMWDPVRLIRYWYAYDVTKEIAKSWRKIIPTILFLPLTEQMPYSHGLAKYVHPPVKVKDSNKKIKSKQPSISAGSYYQGSAGNIKPVVVPPAILHQALPSRYTYFPSPPASVQYYSSREVDSISKYREKNKPHASMSPVPFGDDADDDSNQYPLAHYFVEDESSREEIPISNILLPEQMDYNADDIRSSSIHHVQNTEGENTQKFHPVLQQSHVHYISHAEGGKGLKVPPAFQAGQEVHIVLHPIPVRDFDPQSLKATSGGQAVHFVPVHARSNETYGINLGAVAPVFNSVPRNSAESNNAHEEHTTEISFLTGRNDWFGSNSSDVNEKENSSSKYTKPRVTWISQSKSKVTDRNETDLQSDGTVMRTFSVHSNSQQKFKKDSSSSFTLNRNNINMERLREDLKHGTPVLIPFNKNTYSSEELTETNTKNPVIFPSEEDKSHKNHNHKEHHKEVFSVPIISESGINSSSELSAEKNSTQKVLLFLKRKKHP